MSFSRLLHSSTSVFEGDEISDASGSQLEYDEFTLDAESGLYGPDYEEITQKHLQDIAYELGLIKLSWPEDALPDFDKRKHYPPSYITNSDKEKLLLLYAENFRRQFHFVYADRKPLLLAAENECGIQKMVCTTIRPTKLSYPELSTWEGCAVFVADHLEYESLYKPTALPDRILSPTAVLERHKGHCFEMSTVLCSFLIGSFYNAYVVSGYATREFCFNDLTREENPLLVPEEEDESEKPPEEEPKYQVKAQRDLRSKYLLEMEALEQQKVDEEERQRREQKQREIEDFERPPPDALYAMRVHSWVAVLPGAHDVMEPFFIEPSTGKRYELNCPQYLGLESLWDSSNYWVNLQDCSEGCKVCRLSAVELSSCCLPCWLAVDGLKEGQLYEVWRSVSAHDSSPQLGLYQPRHRFTLYGPWRPNQFQARFGKYHFPNYKNLKFELTDLSCWEHLLLGEPWGMRRLAQMDDDAEIMQEKHLDMPESWVNCLDIPHTIFKRRYPGGGKHTLFKKSKLEQFAPYETRDGLVSRVVTYREYDWEGPESVLEKYESRADQLEESKQNLKTMAIQQKFKRGREDALKEHSFFAVAGSVEDSRTLEFYSEARWDGLEKLEMDPLYLTEHFQHRRDRLYYRHVVFAPRIRGSSGMEGPRRNVLKLIEKYHRDPLKKANDDIAIKTFATADNEIQLKYHYDDERITAQTRVFIKPPLSELGDRLTFNPALTYGYMVDPTDPLPKQLHLFYLLEKLLKDEEVSLFHIREIEDEVAMILKTRGVESAVPKLQVSMFDKERNENFKQGMQVRDKQLREQSAREVEVEVDFLAPYIARLGDPEYLTLEQAREVRDETLQEFKQTVVNRASAIQTKFEKVSQILQQKHHWYEEEQDNLTHEQEEEYFEFSNKMTFNLHTLEIRLNRQRDLAPQRYLALEGALRSDQRLAILYW